MKQSLRDILRSFLIALVAVVIATLLRKYFLGALENKVAWITYYPAVMVAAIYGGFVSGLLTSVFTTFIAVFAWNFITNKPFIADNSDWIGLVVFLLNCILVSGIAEYTRRQTIAKERANKANRAKSIFLANMSHELRTPLNAILGFSRLMQQNENIPEDEQKNLQIINRSGEHLLSLINNVLDISKIEAGKIDINFSSFDFYNVLDDIFLMMTQRAEAKGLKLISQVGKEVPVLIQSDEVKLKQIIINLIGNAIKYTKEGHVKILVNALKNEGADEVTLVVEVTDTGVGISQSDLKNVFNPFFQGGDLSRNEGTGLGLAICKQYTELLRGGISVESIEGAGSSFQVEVPVRIVKRLEPELHSDQLKMVVPSDMLYKVLIVEDQIENWLLLKKVLQKLLCEVVVAENGEQGIKEYKSFKPDLIFMDIRMPFMGGIEATRAIRELENGDKVKIIGISAHVFKEQEHEILTVGMDDFIKKPFQFSDISNCLEKHLKLTFFSDKMEEAKFVKQEKLLTNMFKATDERIVNELFQAVGGVDTERVNAIIEEIGSKDEKLGNILKNYASDLRFTEIHKIVNNVVRE